MYYYSSGDYMNYLSVSQIAEKMENDCKKSSGLCVVREELMVLKGVGNVWTIPENAEKPIDGRKKVLPYPTI